MQKASAGSKAKTVAAWQELSADAARTAGHFRIYASDGTTQHLQGTVSGTGGGGDMELDNTTIALGQSVTVTAFTLIAPNA